MSFRRALARLSTRKSTLHRHLSSPHSLSARPTPLSIPTSTMSHVDTSVLPDLVIPASLKPHREQNTEILLPKEGAFLNPVQQFNRDLSVAVIRGWNELRTEELETKWNAKRRRGDTTFGARETEESQQGEAGPSSRPDQGFRPPRTTILEALSATGLRSIRYAKEIPDVKVVLANDLSPSACEAMRRNVLYNGVAEHERISRRAAAHDAVDGAEVAEERKTPASEERPRRDETTIEEEEGINGNFAAVSSYGRRAGCNGTVRVNEGDAVDLMLQHRDVRRRVDVVDLDPYGTAAPFVDAAVNAVADGGLLGVTCTDLAVLAGSQYPEKSYSNYGGVSVHAEYGHEAALRLVLGSLSSAASRYGRYISPLLSFSIDFYVRVFVRVHTRPEKVKETASQMGIIYTCHHCQAPTIQPFGKIIERESNSGKGYKAYKAAQAVNHGSQCEECGSTLHLGGPMWLGPIQDQEFAARVVKEVEGDEQFYGTWPRMMGMLSLARDELDDPFYITCNRLCGFFHCSSMPTTKAISAILNANYRVSRSHAAPGSLKTNAPRSFLYDLVREHVKTHPVRMDKLPPGAPARKLLGKEMTHTIDFTPHPDASRFEREGKGVYYQINPEANWGPASRAKSFKTDGADDTGGKRKAGSGETQAGEAKKQRAEIIEEDGMNGG